MHKLFFPLLLLTACSMPVQDLSAPSGQAQNMVWPVSPELTRIAYVTSFSSASDLGYRKSFSKRMGQFIAGESDQGMVRPYSIAVSSNLIAVADPGLNTVHIYDNGRNTYRKLSKAGKTGFVSPIGVAIGDDKLYIVDSVLQKVFVLNKRLKLIRTLEGFQRPSSAVLDPNNGILYVADTKAHEIVVFDSEGKRLFKIGEHGKLDGQFNHPSHLGFADEKLFVNDTMNFRIQIFSADGKHLFSFGRHDRGAGGFVQPKGLVVDKDGHIYVADAISNHVQIFDQRGQLLLGFGNEGKEEGNFQMPAGLGIWNNRIYVADSYNHRIQVFQYVQKNN